MNPVRLLLGAVEGAALLLGLAVGPSYLASGLPPSLAAAVSSVFPPFLQYLAVVLAVLSGAATAFGPGLAGGMAKIAQGACMAGYFYLLLHGGSFAVQFALGGSQLSVGATLTLSLALLEAAAVLRMAQGGAEAALRPQPPPGAPTSSA